MQATPEVLIKGIEQLEKENYEMEKSLFSLIL
jgi:hypothetical protein